jgi:hypothetical protein
LIFSVVSQRVDNLDCLENSYSSIGRSQGRDYEYTLVNSWPFRDYWYGCGRGALAELGLDSPDFMHLLVRAETEFSLELESAEREELKSSTVEQFSKYMADHISER